jgi:anti-sigma B factor antagonist
MATDLSIGPVEGIRGIRLEGEFDLSTLGQLEGPLQDALLAGGPVLLDLTALTFMDSSAIKTLLEAARLLESRGWCLYLHVEEGEVSRVLELTEIGQGPNIHVIVHPGAHTPAS